ncbi:MAG: hypothetical protein QME78_09815 [Thermodesulfobacteriota bacterium]|nr:hypothetical protein [Thermodesulfobacteriota bacterium]
MPVQGKHRRDFRYTSQIKDNILRGIQGNVGTLISFRVGANDAEILSKEFSKAISDNDLIGLSNLHVYVRLLINGNVPPLQHAHSSPPKKSRPEVVPHILEYSRKHYAHPLTEVEAEIQEAWIGKKKEEKPPKEFPHPDLGEDGESDEEEGKKAGEKEEKPEVRDPAN